jgi:RNA polymerase sigma-70 factor (ECF subfamily)
MRSRHYVVGCRHATRSAELPAIATAADLLRQAAMIFDDIYAEFHSRIRRYVARLVGESEADDLTQVVFTRVNDALPRFRKQASLPTWIYRIATNAVIDHLRQDAGRSRSSEPIEDDAISDAAATPEALAAQHEMSGCVANYVDKLPLAWRTVLVLSEQEGLTNQEIADALGLTLDNVKIRLHRARVRLKSDLEGGCHVYKDERDVLICAPKPQPVSFRR